MNIHEVFYEFQQQKVTERSEAPKYNEILQFVRNYINENHRTELIGDITTEEVKDRYKILIQNTIHEHQIVIAGCTEEQLIERLYNSMVKFDFLTPYIESDSGSLPDDPLFHTWEEINANRYDDIEVVVAGKVVKLNEGFSSAQDCVDIVKRLSRLGGLNLDKVKCRGKSYIGNGIRIQATLPPCLDEDAGAAFSIRRQKSTTNDKTFFIETQTAVKEELDFLIMCLRNKISIGFAGSTGCGKTTDMNFLMREAAPFNRIYTVEDTREFDCTIRAEDGTYISRVIHTVTRESEDENMRITAADLVTDSLRYDPDIIGLGEMRGSEAKPTIDIGGTDHTIITGLHAAGARSAYRRITSLYLEAAGALDEQMAYENIVEAIPIIVHKKSFPSGERRYMTISEATVTYNGLHPEITFHTIFRFVVLNFERDELGHLKKVIGEHKKVGNISDGLAQKLYENGVPIEEIKRFAADDFMPGKEYQT